MRLRRQFMTCDRGQQQTPCLAVAIGHRQYGCRHSQEQSAGTGRGAACFLALAILASLCGCAPLRVLHDQIKYNEALDDTATAWRSRISAARAWKRHQDMCLDHPHFKHFGSGFRAGFGSICDGNDGCVPAIPPRTYWNARYQTLEGQAQIAAWFEGYPHGVRAAEEQGLGNFSRIQTSLPAYALPNAADTAPFGPGQPSPIFAPPHVQQSVPEPLPLPPGPQTPQPSYDRQTSSIDFLP